MLICKNVADKTIDRILVPETQGATRPGDEPEVPSPRVHFAGILINKMLIPSIHGFDVHVTDGTGKHPTYEQTNFDQLIALNKLIAGKTPPLALLPDNSPCITSAIRMTGGSFVASDHSQLTYKFPPPADGSAFPDQTVPVFARWSTTSNVAELVLTQRVAGAKPMKFTLGTGDDVYIFNFDVLPASPAEFEATPLLCSGTTPIQKVDEDFKWLYWLLETPNGGWLAWNAGNPNRKLPAPYYDCFADEFAILSPGNADCFCAAWEL